MRQSQRQNHFDRLLPCLLLVILLMSSRANSDAPAQPTIPDSESNSEYGQTESTGTRSAPRQFGEDVKYILTSPLRMDRRSALVVGGVAVTIGTLLVADDETQDLVRRNRGDTGTDIARGLKDVGSAQSVLAGNLGLVGVGWLMREDAAGDKLFRTALVSLEAQLFTETISGVTKLAVGRDRPHERRGAHSFSPFEDFDFDESFPSSHAARAFAVAAVFADRYEQPVPALAYTAASLIGVSRIYIDEHFASDVFAGAALGFAVGKVLSRRHPDTDSNLTVVPYLPGNGIGLRIDYAF